MVRQTINKVGNNKEEIASTKASVLDEETQALLHSVRNRNTMAIRWFVISWTILFGLAVFGIYYQNKLAAENKQHIDCIIKDLATPQKPGTTTKYITDLSTECNIQFTQ